MTGPNLIRMPVVLPKTNSLALVMLLLWQLVLIPAPVGAEEPSYVADEIIVCYKKNDAKLASVAEPSQTSTDSALEEDFIDELVSSYKLQKNIQPLARLKNKKRSRYKKFRKFKKQALSHEIATVKLDHKLSKKELQKLVQRLSRERYQNSNYQIEAVYPNSLYQISETAAVSNDPHYSKQWALSYIQPEKFWQHSKGEGAVVAVVDTGVDYNHEDLAENIWVNTREIANNGVDDDGNGYIDDIRGWDFVESAGYGCSSGEDCGQEDNDPNDYNSHGTHVAGIIAAVEGNAKGISGIAPKAKIMPLRAGYSAGVYAFLKTSDIIDAISYAINNDADVINMSFTGSELSVLGDILELADKLGIVLVAAAGNSYSGTPNYPAALPQVISVGALTTDNYQAAFSNYGDSVDIAAPGSWILSTIPGNQYTYKQGTSMASPCVAGVAALIKAKNKLHNPTTAEVRKLLLGSAQTTQFKRYARTGDTMPGLSADIKFPVTVDDIVVPAHAIAGNPVSMSASASDSQGFIVEYEWVSDRDGVLSNQESFSVSDLSLGSHVITVRARDSQGEWSEPVFKVLDVVESKQIITTEYNDLQFKIKKRNGLLYAGMRKVARKQVKAYKWVSNIDGTIGERRGVSLKQLTPGYHKVSLLVQDRDGVWSEPVQRVLDIRS